MEGGRSRGEERAFDGRKMEDDDSPFFLSLGDKYAKSLWHLAMSSEKISVGLIGCGKISPRYMEFCRNFEGIEVVACADLDYQVASRLAKEFSIRRVYAVEELLDDPDIEIVVNLTFPTAHTTVNRASLEHGKHVYCEKPFGLDRDEGAAILKLAARKQLRVGCAPDTVMGPGIQTCRKLIDEGAIGEPTAASAFYCGSGQEHWHPNPAFFYQPGGGPLFDMGPYYLTSLAVLFGPAKSVAAKTKHTFSERVATSPERNGLVIKVETPTHLTGVVEYANGVLATTTFSFDTVGFTHLPLLEFYGTEGSLSAPNPNHFDGPVFLREKGNAEWREIPLTHGHSAGRGLGLVDMAQAIRTGRPHRANGELALHVLDLMQAYDESQRTGRHIELTTTCKRPAMIPTDLEPGCMD